MNAISRPAWVRLALPWAAVSLGIAALAAGLYAAGGETAFVRGLWLAGIALALLSAGRAQVLSGRRDHAESSPRFRVEHILLLAGLLGAALALRIYKLDTIPFEISTDMTDYGLAAREYVLGSTREIFGTGWFYIPRLEFQLAAFTMRLAGNNLFGLYLATVIFGLVNLLGVYLLVWRLFDSHQIAWITLAVLVFNPAHIEYSRISAFITPWASGYLGLFLFVDGLRSRRTLSLAAAGILCGFSMEVYPAGRIMPLLVALILAYAWFFRRGWIRENLPGLGWFVLGGAAALGPNLVHIARHWDIYTARFREVYLFAPEIQTHLKNTYHVSTGVEVFWEQVRRSFFTFQFYSDKSAQFYYPHGMFHSLLAPLVGLGLASALARLRRPGMFFTAAAFLLMIITGGVLTVNAPTWSRLVGVIPLAAVLIALPLDMIIQRLSNHVRMRPVLVLAAAAFVLTAGLQEWRIYVRDTGGYARPIVAVGRYLGGLPESFSACGVTSEYSLTFSEPAFLAWPRRLAVLDPANPRLDDPACAVPPVVWIFTPDQESTLEQVRRLYPGGEVEVHRNYEGRVDFVSYLRE